MDVQKDLLLPAHTRRPSVPPGGAEPALHWGRVHRGDAAGHVPSERGSWDSFHPAFARAVRGPGPVPVDPRDAIASATVLDAARLSATDGGTVRFRG